MTKHKSKTYGTLDEQINVETDFSFDNPCQETSNSKQYLPPSYSLGSNDENPEKEVDTSNTENYTTNLLYTIEDIPPWSICFFLGFQHYLSMLGSTITVPLTLAPKIGIGPEDPAQGYLISTILFVSGIATLLQTTIGVRLPVIQGGTFSFLLSTLAIMSLPKWLPPDFNGPYFLNLTTVERTELWQLRMREIQGDIMVASLIVFFVGIFGLLGFILKFIGPLVITPIVTLIGLSGFDVAATMSSKHWGIAVLTIFLIFLFSQYLGHVNIPCCNMNKQSGSWRCHRTWYPLFTLFPVLLAIMTSWLFCLIFTVTNVFPTDPAVSGYEARTDIKISVLYNASWFRFPYPGQWGTPTVSVEGVLGMLAAAVCCCLESVGNYYACARFCNCPPPPVYAINRGITIEGVGCLLAGAWGSGNGTTSYSENIAAIGITKVASRRVIQCSGIFMLFFALIGKFMALFVMIPEPIIGGCFCVTFGMIAAIGLSNLQHVSLDSPRNVIILGFSIFLGLTVPTWIKSHPGAIKTGSSFADQIFTVLLTTNMFVGGALGMILDMTIPGTLQERGLLKWNEGLKSFSKSTDSNDQLTTFELPGILSRLKNLPFAKYMPICSTFKGCPVNKICTCRKTKQKNDSNNIGIP